MATILATALFFGSVAGLLVCLICAAVCEYHEQREAREWARTLKNSCDTPPAF